MVYQPKSYQFLLYSILIYNSFYIFQYLCIIKPKKDYIGIYSGAKDLFVSLKFTFGNKMIN